MCACVLLPVLSCPVWSVPTFAACSASILPTAVLPVKPILRTVSLVIIA